MFKKAEMNGLDSRGEQLRASEEVNITLRKLQALREKISDLRAQCEELRRLSLKTDNLKADNLKADSFGAENDLVYCSQCGESISPGQEIVVKSSDKAEKKRYHKECFKLLWASAT